MTDELLEALRRLHAEVLSPEFAEVRADVREEVAGSRHENLEHFDRIYGRFDRLETEYQAIAAAVTRLEGRPGGADLTGIRHASYAQRCVNWNSG